MCKGVPVGAPLWYGVAGVGNKEYSVIHVFFYDLVQFRFFSFIIPAHIFSFVIPGFALLPCSIPPIFQTADKGLSLFSIRLFALRIKTCHRQLFIYAVPRKRESIKNKDLMFSWISGSSPKMTGENECPGPLTLSFPIFLFCHFPFFSIVIPAEAEIQDK